MSENRKMPVGQIVVTIVLAALLGVGVPYFVLNVITLF